MRLDELKKGMVVFTVERLPWHGNSWRSYRFRKAKVLRTQMNAVEQADGRVVQRTEVLVNEEDFDGTSKEKFVGPRNLVGNNESRMFQFKQEKRRIQDMQKRQEREDAAQKIPEDLFKKYGVKIKPQDIWVDTWGSPETLEVPLDKFEEIVNNAYQQGRGDGLDQASGS
jgi:hypothetical protein